MAELSPKLKAALGAVAILAGLSFFWGGDDEPISGETFDAPLAFFDDESPTPTTWVAPPVTRNPFLGSEFSVDDDAVSELEAEQVIDEGEEESLPSTTVTEPTRTVVTTESTEDLASIIDRRVPAGAPPVTTVPPADGDSSSTSIAGDGTAELDGTAQLEG